MLIGSPAIDAGDPAIAADPTEFDQRDAPFRRVVQGFQGSSTIIDMGAYERQGLAGSNFVVDTITDENDADYSVGDLSLREALGLANGDIGANTVQFDPVLFATPQSIALQHGELDITGELTIDGPAAEQVIIDAQQASRIFHILAGEYDVTMRGLTLTNGRTVESDSPFLNEPLYSGGAIHANHSGSLSIEASAILNNSTLGDRAHGGAIRARSDLTISGSLIAGNSTAGANSEGGALITTSGNTSIIDSTLTGNSTTGDDADGGAIFSSHDVTLTDTTISGNSTSGDDSAGGGIFVNLGNLTVINSTIEENYTLGDYSSGGGLFMGGVSGLLTLTNSVIDNNYTTGYKAYGGGIRAGGDLIADLTTISNNRTTGYRSGGGGAMSFGEITLTASRVFGNRTMGNRAHGGGLFSALAPLVITNSTFDSNSTSGTRSVGGGIYAGAFSVMTFTQVTVSNNFTLGDNSGGWRHLRGEFPQLCVAAKHRRGKLHIRRWVRRWRHLHERGRSSRRHAPDTGFNCCG